MFCLTISKTSAQYGEEVVVDQASILLHDGGQQAVQKVAMDTLTQEATINNLVFTASSFLLNISQSTKQYH